MALQPNSYGDTTEIARLVPRYANSGVFDETTNPLLVTIESETDQVSGAVNSVLMQEGFEIPVTQADVKLMLDGFVNKMVAEIANGIRGSGRFGPMSQNKGFGPTSQAKSQAKGKWFMIMEDTAAFIKGMALGFERLGATRTFNVTAQMGFRDTDKSGTETQPIRQREEFGETYEDWDR